jgi:stage V sporulation protein K
LRPRDSNPGLRSRFSHYIEFPDFSPGELVQVFEWFASGAKVTLGPGMPETLEPLFRLANQVDNFGNARYARSIFERAYANMATRVLADGKIERSEVDEMLVEDLPPADPFIAAKCPIGFRPR